MKLPAGQPSRIDMELRQAGVPTVQAFGRYSHAMAIDGLDPHRHPGAIEICYLVRGRQIYEVGGHRYILRGGDVFLTFPGEAHSTDGEPQEKGLLYWISFLNPAKTGKSFLGLPEGESAALWSALMAIRNDGRRSFAGVGVEQGNLDMLAVLVRQKPSALWRARIANRLGAFLFQVIDAHRCAGESEPQGQLGDVFAAIQNGLENPDEITIPKLAAIAGLSTSRFQARFKAEVGIPPAEYVLRARIAEAERRLRKRGATVTDVAFELGFSSSQYFAVTFRRFTNRRPSDLLKNR